MLANGLVAYYPPTYDLLLKAYAPVNRITSYNVCYTKLLRLFR